MHPLAQRLLAHIQQNQLLKPGDRVGVAVSGGIDSGALLRLLLELRTELGIVLSVVHFNHKLRGKESDGDQQFVAGLAREWNLDFLCDGDDTAEHAREQGISLEAAARDLRYGLFRHLIRDAEKSPLRPNPARSGAPLEIGLHRLDNIITGHTLDDQAETVLLRMIRGTGVTGLGGIHPRLAVVGDHDELCGEIVRPLLEIRRRELEQYLGDIGQPWREDSTNSDHAFTRNRLRKLVVPLLEKEFNPAIAENLAELADIARAEEEYWDNEIAGWMGTTVHWIEPEWAQQSSQPAALVRISPSGNQLTRTEDNALQSKIDSAPWLVANASVSRPWFLSEPIAVQRRVVKAIGEHAGIPLEFKHIEEILRFAEEDGHAGGELSLPLGWKLAWHLDELMFVTPDLREAKPPQDYLCELTISGRVPVPEIGIEIEARLVPVDRIAEYNPDELLNADSLPGPLRVRNWRAGDRFWPAHSKSPKKIKELLQERHIPQPGRSLWPVVVSGEEIVWVRGFAAHMQYRAKAGHAAIAIVARDKDEGDKLR